MSSTARYWAFSQSTPIFRKRPKGLFTMMLLLAIYVTLTICLALSRLDLPIDKPIDWRLNPYQQQQQQQQNQHQQSITSQGFGERRIPNKDLHPLPSISVTGGHTTTVRNLSTDSGIPYTPTFGFVMRDFARRVLSRHISSSNVLVISRDATRAAKQGIQARRNNHTAENVHDTVDAQSPYSIGGTFLLHAAMEGHDIHAIDFGLGKDGEDIKWNQTLDQWWTSFDDATPRTDEMQRWSSSTSTPKWIIAAIFDHFVPEKLESTDQVWIGAERFLQESTMTYVVVAMHSRKVQGGYQYGGLLAAKLLLEHRYKLQTLLLSHYMTDPGKEAWTESRYGPNAMFKSIDNIQDLLHWGADAAETFETGSENKIFTAYIFATQGLDLAIPSNRIFIDDSSRVVGTESTLQINLYKPLQFKKCPQAMIEQKLDIAFTELLGDTSIQVRIRLDDSSHQIRHYHPHAPPHLGFTYQYTKPGEHTNGPRPEDVNLWVSNDDFNKAEAACAKFSNFSKCVTRVVEQKLLTRVDDRVDRETVPNMLLILIDPISRPHFHRSMPKTAKALENLGFIQFGNYTAIGPNSGKNQAALYSGMLLANRDGIKKDSKGGQWLWDRLRDRGFVTLKAENGCVENSNMLKSLEPNTTHGSELTHLFCFEFDRPNCLGPDLAARHLMQYGENFISTYESRRKQTDPLLRWAAFLHFIDTHEDTMVLSSMLDAEMSSFLARLGDVAAFENAVVIVTSDHGLHYGPYFQSRSGRREATEPVLYIKIPRSIQSETNMDIFVSNAEMWTTAFDLHETILSLTIPPKDIQGKRRGMSFFTPFPERRKTCLGSDDIPPEYCALIGQLNTTQAQNSLSCTKMPKPPSILSFYSDISPTKRTHFSINCDLLGNKPASVASLATRCQCATSHRGWYRCGEHPWGPEEMHSTKNPEEYFALVKCRGQKMSVDTRVVPGGDLVSQLRQRKLTANSRSSPNVIFIEVDSVSVAYADRHLPETRAFLKRYRLRKNSLGQIECNDSVCSPDFKYFSLSGPNSIANQIAALSGCVVVRFYEKCFESKTLRHDQCSSGGMYRNLDGDCVACSKGLFLTDPLSPCQSNDEADCCTANFPTYNATRVCQDSSRTEYGLQLFRRGPRRHATFCPVAQPKAGTKLDSPWMFDVAKRLGYVTYFGDEFCYEGSPFVAQNNIFPLSPDFELQHLYCRLQESRQFNFSAMGPRLCASQRSATGAKSMNPGFDLINEIWQSRALDEIPKFVYLNAMAAHDYDPDWIKMVAAVEDYDRQLASFLHSLVLHPHFSNSIIIVRSDHGLQGGPSTVEYSMQVEHREPWTQMLLPQSIVGDSLEPLFLNQERIVTSHDIYRTLRDLMVGGMPTDESSSIDDVVLPPWSYNLFHAIVPTTRTCQDAKVPTEFCLCEEQVEYRPPSLGVCNPFDQYGDLFCPEHLDFILPDVLEL